MLDAIMRNSPAAIAVLRGSCFRFEMVNEAYSALAPGESMAGRTVAEVWPSAAGLVLPLLESVRATRRPYHATAMPVPLHRGPGTEIETRWFDFSYVSLDQDRVLVIAIEVTAKKRAEQELITAHQELAAIHAYAPVALFLVEDGFQGCRPGNAVGCNRAALAGDCASAAECAACVLHAAVLESIRAGNARRNLEVWLPLTVGGDLESRCLLVSVSPLPDAGAPKVLVCAQDVTELKRAVRQLEGLLAEKTVLFQELHHRVKNNLAVISSLLRMKADGAGSAAAKRALEESYQRIISMALIHEQLYESNRLDSINFSEYAEQLIHRLHRALVDQPARVSLEFDLDPIELAIEQAVPCGLVLNELLTNAFKYAFPGGNRGRIRVSFHRTPVGPLELAVEDNGIGLSPDLLAGTSPTLGLRIVGILVNQLDGVLEHQRCPGTRIVLRFTPPPVARASKPPRSNPLTAPEPA